MCLFRRKRKKQTDGAVPSTDEISEIMYNENLTFADDVTDVIYCPDKTKRYVVLRHNSDGYYRFRYEEMIVFDEYEQQLAKTNTDNMDGVLPGYWAPINRTLSIFGTSREAVDSIRFEPEYKQYFVSDK